MSSREDWLKWRTQGLGSADAPTIMGCSPWQTPLELWKVKTGRVVPDTEPNFVQRRGLELEPQARAHYELIRDIDMPPICLEHPVHAWLRASLDGWNADQRRILEIKAPGKDDHALALAGKVPEKYFWQLMHQFMVADALHADYYSFDGSAGALVEVERNLDAEAKLFQAEEAFWKLVQTDTPPPLSSRDYLEVTDPNCVQLCEDWKTLKVAGKSRALDQVREELKKYLVHPRIECSGVRLLTVQRQNGPTIEVRLKEKA